MTHFTAFDGMDCVARGDMAAMITAQRGAIMRGVNLLIFDDVTGRVRDVDLRDAPPPARGRPKLGVKAREVTLLPRHWDWLNAQKGGASAALRRMVETAMRNEAGTVDPARARDAAYAFMSAIAGDLAGFEEASRKLFAGDLAGLAETTRDWPKDVVVHLRHFLPAMAE